MPAEVEYEVWFTGPGRGPDAFVEEGVPTKVISAPEPLQRYGKSLLQLKGLMAKAEFATALAKYQAQIAWELKRSKIDLVHANEPRGGLFMGPAARAVGIPMVSHLRGEVPFGGLPWDVFEQISSKIVCVSKAVQREISPRSASRGLTVYDGIGELPSGFEVPDSLKKWKSEGRVILGMFASVCPFKGQHHAIEALGMLENKERLGVVFVGDTPGFAASYEQHLHRRVEQLGLDGSTHFAGWQDNPFAFYEAADIAILPSVTREELHLDTGEVIQVQGNEGFPRTHLESMRFGLPIIGTAIAGVPEQVLDGQTGFVVPPQDDEALAEAIEKLVSDQELRERFGAAGEERVRTMFSMENYLSGFMDVYEELLR